MVFATTVGLTGEEKKRFIKGTVKLVLYALISVVICYMDDLMYKVLHIISSHGRIEYHEEGEHTIDIQVKGDGFMSAIVRDFLSKFGTKKKLDRLTTNHECLPDPSKTDDVIIGFIFGTLILVWLLIYVESLGSRTRRVIGSFFYRKREKKRVLFMYNNMFRKRLGYLRHMRHQVRKHARKRELKKQVGLIVSLQRQFPNLCRCLAVIKSAKENCIVCDDKYKDGFHRCETPECGVVYCPECWRDVKMRCYNCGDDRGAGSGGSDASTLTDTDTDN